MFFQKNYFFLLLLFFVVVVVVIVVVTSAIIFVFSNYLKVHEQFEYKNKERKEREKSRQG